MFSFIDLLKRKYVVHTETNLHHLVVIATKVIVIIKGTAFQEVVGSKLLIFVTCEESFNNHLSVEAQRAELEVRKRKQSQKRYNEPRRNAKNRTLSMASFSACVT